VKKYFHSKDEIPRHIIKNDTGLVFDFLATNGTVRKISLHDVMVNLFMAHPLEGGLANIYIRVIEKGAVRFVPVFGPDGESHFAFTESSAMWEGAFCGLSYRVVFAISREANAWFYDVAVTNTSKKSILCDVVYMQDKALSDECAVRINEAYTSQYIDHKVFQHKKYGPVIASRQNLPFKGRCPWMIDGCIDGSDAYLTDGGQFYGLSYKETNVPEALAAREWKSAVVQEEFAVSALKTAAAALKPRGTRTARFFAFVQEDHREASGERDLRAVDRAEELCRKALESIPPQKLDWKRVDKNVFNNTAFFRTEELNTRELKAYFGDSRRHIEARGATPLSFFAGRSHVVTKTKDLMLARTHGNIIRSGAAICPNDDILAAQQYITGGFTMHLSIGNTSFDQLLSHQRNTLNIHKASGQRIFVRNGGRYEMLGLPSAYEMGLTFGRWIYKGKLRTVEVTAWADPAEPVAYLEVSVTKGKKASFLVTHEVTLGGAEYEQRGWLHIDEAGGAVEATPDKGSFLGTKRPQAAFFIAAQKEAVERIGCDELLYHDGVARALPYAAFLTAETSSVRFAVGGSVVSAEKTQKLLQSCGFDRRDKAKDIDAGESRWRGVMGNACLALPKGNAADREGLDKVNDILPWYLHNALVHFSVPFGLEQYKGGAWGVRDVLQGPVEAFLTLGKADDIRHMLRQVFAAQYIETGNWPQWFMFDVYRPIQSVESHGDVIVWPFKAVCEYIEATGDFSILDEKIPYTRRDDPEKRFTGEKEPVSAHLMRAAGCIRAHFIPGTHLSSYDGGDWDDTLQPASREMRERMASGWTILITFQYLNAFAEVLRKTGNRKEAGAIAELAHAIGDDYRRYIMKDGVSSGFIHLSPDGAVDYMLHPRDKRTHIKYRLLPMTRGMISGFFTQEEKERHYDIIKKNLDCPDGARLMDTCVPYGGGPAKWFCRAEMAANFGREIGLMYVHAHLRFCEALAKIGKGDELFDSLLKVVPITIADRVANAATRQSNAYFSSSDGDFKTRYDVDYAKLRKGSVPVDGGWRIYSSGPGLFIRQVFAVMLGIRPSFGFLAIDPVIPPRFDGLTYQYDYRKGARLRCVYRTGGKRGCGVSRVTLNGEPLQHEPLENPYRKAGIKVPLKMFEGKLREGLNELIVTM